MCKKQKSLIPYLSQSISLFQNHYYFGLRSVKAVISLAGEYLKTTTRYMHGVLYIVMHAMTIVRQLERVKYLHFSIINAMEFVDISSFI
jgi:hypothetical protein